jgi:hypothetical protein
MNIQCENAIIKKDNERRRLALKSDEKFCPTCGRTIKKTQELFQ